MVKKICPSESLNQEQHDILIGSLHGDLHMEQNGRNYRCKIDHSLRQKEYVEWKHLKLSPYSLDIVESKSAKNKQTGKTYDKIRFATFSAPVFKPYFDLGYDEFWDPVSQKRSQKKVVKEEFIKEFKSPISLAVLFMDDGGTRDDGDAFRLHVENCTDEELSLWRKVLLTNFNLRVNRQRHANGYRLAINVDQSQIFRNHVQSYIEKQVPSMAYKLKLP